MAAPLGKIIYAFLLLFVSAFRCLEEVYYSPTRISLSCSLERRGANVFLNWFRCQNEPFRSDEVVLKSDFANVGQHLH